MKRAQPYALFSFKIWSPRERWNPTNTIHQIAEGYGRVECLWKNSSSSIIGGEGLFDFPGVTGDGGKGDEGRRAHDSKLEQFRI